MSVSQLTIYNGALLLAGERFLSSLSEEREPRRLLDHVWDSNGVRTCLEKGQWYFAMRAVQLDYDTGVEPDFGYRRAFQKPDDWVLTCGLCQDEQFNTPLTQYVFEAGYWYADLETIYLRYISDDAAYGMDLNKWPEAFREYVEEYFCSKIVRKLTGSAEAEAESHTRLRQKLLSAKSNSLMAEPTKFPARGGWGLSRNGGGSARHDRGNSGSLIG